MDTCSNRSGFLHRRHQVSSEARGAGCLGHRALGEHELLVELVAELERAGFSSELERAGTYV